MASASLALPPTAPKCDRNPRRLLVPRAAPLLGFRPPWRHQQHESFWQRSGLSPEPSVPSLHTRDLSAYRVPPPPDGLLLVLPCRSFSPDRHLRGSPSKAFPSRTAGPPLDVPCPLVVASKTVPGLRSPPSGLCSMRESVGSPRCFHRCGVAPLLSWAFPLQGFLPSRRGIAFTMPPLASRRLRFQLGYPFLPLRLGFPSNNVPSWRTVGSVVELAPQSLNVREDWLVSCENCLPS